MSGPYTSRLLELAANIKNIAPINSIDGPRVGYSKKTSKICGSEIELRLELDEALEKITKFSINPKACALGQASAAILSNNIIGATTSEILKARNDLKAMLKENGKTPIGRFWELSQLEAVADYPMRHASTMLAWEAALDAIEEAKNP